MNSGIYLLKFQTGDTYVGQAKDFQQRWARHDKEMIAGTHTRLVQDAYNRGGCILPAKYKLVICHPDWLDLYEALYIYRERPPLNTQIPKPPGRKGEGLLDWMHEADRADLGMLEQLEELEETLDVCEGLRAQIRELVDGWKQVGEEAMREVARQDHYKQLQLELATVTGTLGEELERYKEWHRHVNGLGWLGRLCKLWKPL